MSARSSRSSRSFFLIAFAAAAALTAVSVRAQRAATTTAEGVYTAAQADRGEADYGRYCARCHGADLDGIGAAPMLYSSKFLDRWREDALRTLYDYIATNMPLDGQPGPGRLTPAEYLDLTAFLLKSSDLRAGSDELRAADLDTTLLVGPEGPQPLPPATTVRVVGCLTAAGSSWSLTQAAPPARVRQADVTNAAEIARSASTAAGDRTYRLPTITDDHSAAELNAQANKRIQIKGVLNDAGGAARISVLSFTPLAQPCSR